jgi:hypothetical protein
MKTLSKVSFPLNEASLGKQDLLNLPELKTLSLIPLSLFVPLFSLAGVLDNMEIVTEMNSATSERTKPLRHQSASKPIRKPIENDFEDEEEKTEDELEGDEIEEGITEGKNSVKNIFKCLF